MLVKDFKKESLMDKSQKSIGGASTPTVSSTSRMRGYFLQSICKITGVSLGYIDLICMKKKGMFPIYQ